MENETIFETANRICQKEVNIFLDPYVVKRKRGKIKNISIGQRMKALKKWMNVLHREYVKRHEVPCAVNPCIDCCHVVPIIRSKTEFEYLKRALDMNLYAKSLGDTMVPFQFKEWSQFCRSTGINPNRPFIRSADMMEWMQYRIPCLLYSTSYEKCMIEDTKPIDCRFGRNIVCPSLDIKRPNDLTPWEIVSMNLESRIVMAEAYSKINRYIELLECETLKTWTDGVNQVMVKADAAMFPDKPKFTRRPIHTLFEFRP